MAFNYDFANPGDWAAMYRSLGIQVVPGHQPRAGFNWKRPNLSEWKDFQETLVPDAVFQRWFGVNATPSMGILTGRASGNIFVIDLDIYKTPSCMDWWRGVLEVHNHGFEPETWQQTTGGGGKQLFFRAPMEWNAPTNRTPIGVDIRGQGGFAVLPPSRHESGNEYHWIPGLSPWETEVEVAEPWLLEAVDKLVAKYGAETKQERVERTQSPAGDFDGFGVRHDGREEYMTSMVWAAVLKLHAECPIMPTDGVVRDETYETYERKVKSRIVEPGTSKRDLLDREGRGYTLFCQKWDRALGKWDAEVALESASQATDKPQGTISFVDFFTLHSEEVVEEPDYIEPDFAGPGSFVLIAGPPKAQKSFLLQEILVASAVGGRFLGGKFQVPKPLRVFYLQAEMNRKLLRKRAREFKLLSSQEKSRLQDNLILSERFHMILNADGVKIAIETIRAAFPKEPPDVIAVDPLANVFDGENENDNTQLMRFIAGRLEIIRQAINPLACIILVHHAKKANSEDLARDPFIAIRGAGALRGYYDSAIVIFRKNEEEKTRQIHFELRGGESPEPMSCMLVDGRFQEAAEVKVEIDMGRQMLNDLRAAWNAGKPLSIKTQTRKEGRYAPLELSRKYNVSARAVDEILVEWMRNDIITTAMRDTHSKISGIKVIGAL